MKLADAIQKVLEEHQPEPMHYVQIAEEIESRRWYTSLSKTPAISVNSAFVLDAKNGNPPRFFKVSRGVYGLRGVTTGEAQEATSGPATQQAQRLKGKGGFDEIDLHPFLAYFAKNEWQCSTKTINQSARPGQKTRRGVNEWVHPDMIAVTVVSFSSPEVKELRELLALPKGADPTFRSFEIKKTLENDSELTQKVFQTVANSSWAHEGYLVAKDIDDEDVELMDKLRRLCATHGIGVIKLDTDDPDKSRVLIPARGRSELDWTTIDEVLCGNTQVKEFFKACANGMRISPPRMSADDFDRVAETPQELVSAFSA